VTPICLRSPRYEDSNLCKSGFERLGDIILSQNLKFPNIRGNMETIVRVLLYNETSKANITGRNPTMKYQRETYIVLSTEKSTSNIKTHTAHEISTRSPMRRQGANEIDKVNRNQRHKWVTLVKTISIAPR
jgi:hypothetical protein